MARMLGADVVTIGRRLAAARACGAEHLRAVAREAHGLTPREVRELEQTVVRDLRPASAVSG
jgi:hypothetical protein